MKHAIEAALRFPASGAQRALFAATLSAIAVGFCDRASAQTAFSLPAPPLELAFLPPVSGGWTVMIGAEGTSTPDFEGAKGSRFSPVPIFSIRRAGSVDQFRSPRDNASIALIDFGDFRAGAAGKFVSSRKADNYSGLNGLGDVNAAFELGGFIEFSPRLVSPAQRDAPGLWRPSWRRFRFFGGLYRAGDPGADDFRRPALHLGEHESAAPYFGIDAVQAMASGLPQFDAKGGAHSAGAGVQVKYRINPQWEVHSYVEYDRLLGDAANSPLVTLRGSANQTTVGVGASYSFNVRIR